MQALAIIEPFNERKDLPARVIPRVIRLMMNEFILEGAEEAFRHGMIVAIPFAAHARRDPECRQLTLIREAGVLCPLIRVVNQPRLDAPLTHGHGQRIEGELLIGVPSHGPADHPPRIQIQDIKNLSKMKNLETHAPEAMKAFVAFDKAAVADGAIPGKYKELIALGSRS
jgi:hypothetical protein